MPFKINTDKVTTSPYSRENIATSNFPPNACGEMIIPCWTFEKENNRLKVSNPELNEQERAATAYFAILARNPIPTTMENVYFSDWQNLLSDTPEYYLGLEYNLANPVQFERGYGWNFSAYQEAPAPEVYLYNVQKLRTYLAKLGLYDGIEATLKEESRKLQAQAAAASASAQAAAKALAMSRITEDMTEEARIEAAERQAEAQRQYDAAIEQENRTREQLNRISNGLPPESSGVSVGAVVAIGVAVAIGAYLIGKRGK